MTKPIITVLDDYERISRKYVDWSRVDAQADVRIHTEPLRGHALRFAVASANVLVLMRDRTPLNAELIAQLPNLKLVLFTGTRNNTLDTAALKARGIPVCHTLWGPSKDATTELTWALILAAQKRMEAHMAGLRAGVWRPLPGLVPILRGKTIGLVGLGEIGGRMAKIAIAFGMNVITWSPNMTPARAAAAGATSVTFDELVKLSHVISLHIVLSEKTHKLFGEKQFAAMRTGAIFVNTSRAGLADEAAMVTALKSGALGHAALDVYSEEPLPASHPMLALENVTLTPHLGFVCEPVFRQFFTDVISCLEAWCAEKPLPNVLA